MIRASRASAFGLGMLLAAGGTVAAQTTEDRSPTAIPGAVPIAPLTGPLRLTPSTPQVAPAPDPAPGKDPLSRTQREVDTTPSLTSRRGIQVERLSAIDANSIGNLTPADGGFPPEMWDGTPRPVIEQLVARIPRTIRSPVMRDLARRLLMSAAALPSWPESVDAPPLQLIVHRVSLLQEMGALKDARSLLSITPGRRTEPELLRLEAQDRLLANDFGGACQVTQAAREVLSKPYWQRLLAFCQALQGDKAGAAFGANLLSENGETSDPAFQTIIDRMLSGSEAPLESLAEPTPLHLAMLRTAKLKIPADAVATESPAILFSVGVSPNAELETRLAAAERAAEFGAMSHARLAEIYMGLKFEPDELNNALSLSSVDRSPRGRALLFQAAQVETVAMARAAIISKAFEIAYEERRFLHAMQLYRPLLADLPTSSEMAWFAPEAARALYALDRPVPARAWVGELRQAAARGDEYRLLLDGIWFLGLLTDSEMAQKDFDESLSAWQRFHRAKSGDRANARIGAGLLLLEALGRQVPGEAWWNVLESSASTEHRTADPAFRTAMIRAAMRGRKAEGIAHMLVTLGRQMPGITDVGTVADAVTSLRQMGLENEARLLVLETAAVAGL